MTKKINVMSRKLIKPSTPTPLHLNKYKISFIDELSPACNINVLLFYPSPPKTLFITHLEDSLANILPRFYPLAGRYIKNDHTIDCNDEGAEFVLAEAADIELADLTTKSVDDDELTDLLSRQFYETDGPTDPLLSIQITRLKLDDVAIGISVSHRVFDASSLGTFVSAWSNAAVIIAPSFDPPSFFPAKNIGHGYVLLTGKNPNIVVKRVLFSKEDIDKLRSKITNIRVNGEPKKVFVSRVRLVSAFIAKALMRMDRAKHGNRSGACFKIYQPVNMRERTIPPLPKYSCGNLVVTSVAETKEVVRFEDLVYMLGESIGKTVTIIGQTLALGVEGHKLIMDSSVNNRSMSMDIPLRLTDWSKFGFYEADFGWGKPVFVGFGAMPVPYATTLVDNKNGDGIEAWVHVNRGDLLCFDRYVHLSQMDSEDF